MNKKEIEVRTAITKNEYSKILSFIKKNGNIKKKKQEDIYFCHDSFIKSKKTRNSPYIIRIRKDSKKTILAYKSFQKEGSWIETETEVSDPKAMVLILNSINHHQYLKIKKVRISTFINKIEINLDSIENLGTFLELEKIGKNFEKERNSLIKFAREILELKVSTIIDKGYVQMMEEKIK